MLMIVTAAALLRRDGRVLVQRRPPGKMMAGLWEFPGGKLEPGETPEAALIRELAEELGIAVDPASLVPLTYASQPLGERHMLLLLYGCRQWTGEPQALEASALAWVDPVELGQLPRPPADAPFVAVLAPIMRQCAAAPPPG